MLRNEAVKKTTVIALSLCMAASSVTVCQMEVPVGAATGIQAEKPAKEKDYIVMTKTEQQANILEDEYDSPYVTNANREDCLLENQMASLTLTKQEAKTLSAQKNVAFVEEDVVVKASRAGEKTIHKKNVVEKVQKKNSKEWNLRMIHADRAQKIIRKKRKKGDKNRVRIAILDSGVDYNTDMNIAATFSLVPGEEEISPLFMDGTGHGTSVAGLAAAKNNGEGITGVDPYAEIYSIRVLDDDNCSPVSRVIEGIYMAIEAKADIINMSFGVDTYSQALAQAVQDAEDAGILVIAAAGNTGSSGDAGTESTVQYPAALDGVLAVGSVDKRGERADHSATGAEISLTAPGELVKSTGMFGNGEVVESGTSLAAPQAAGAAALILERDRNVSPDFVRELLTASANAYGKANEYGAGLIDISYALEHYDSFKEQYKGKKNPDDEIPENEAKIPVFRDTGCVKGSWSVNNHENLVKSNNKYVKDGARFNDKKDEQYFTGSYNGKDLYRYQGMTNNPWWHGYYKNEVKENYLNNYVAAYIYETRLANAVGSNKQPPYAGLSNKVKNEIDDDIAKINWYGLYAGTAPNNAHKRDFLWGMAIHNLADTFAHSAAVNGNRVKHPDADDINIYKERWTCASKAVASALQAYNTPNATGTASHFASVCKQNQFKLINIYPYMESAVGRQTAEIFSSHSITYK